MTTGGDAVVRGLEQAGVEVVFGLPGVHNLAAWKAFDRSGVRLVGVRHEQTAGYAADGYARATGRLGVAITTTGPGRVQRRHGRGGGVGLAQPAAGPRHRRPHDAAPARASTAACCTRRSTRPASSGR